MNSPASCHQHPAGQKCPFSPCFPAAEAEAEGLQLAWVTSLQVVAPGHRPWQRGPQSHLPGRVPSLEGPGHTSQGRTPIPGSQVAASVLS